jgi:hypothetical protein
MSSSSLWKTLQTGNQLVKFGSAGSSLFLSDSATTIYRCLNSSADPVDWFTSNVGSVGGIAIDAQQHSLYVILDYTVIKRITFQADGSNPVLDNTFSVNIPAAHFLAIRNGVLYSGCVDAGCVTAVDISTGSANTNKQQIV